MVSEITIRNFKSIEEITLQLGRVTVLIGENGSGKTNILESIGFLGAAVAEKLDNEFLWSRGIRNVAPDLMLASFVNGSKNRRRGTIGYRLTCDGCDSSDVEIGLFPASGRIKKPHWGFSKDGAEYVVKTLANTYANEMLSLAKKSPRDPEGKALNKAVARIFDSALRTISDSLIRSDIEDFLIYSPENSVVRPMSTESQIQPLGTKGEGLFAHLRTLLMGKSKRRAKRLRESLNLLTWFSGVEIPKDLLPGEGRLAVHDRFLARAALDERSVNEGFLFLLFYFVLFLSPETPKFFAIDNIDASLNPKLCAELMRQLVKLAKENGKQVIVTTHNPGLLDGLDLTDKEQKLYAVSRTSAGRTAVRDIPPPIPIRKGDLPLKLSHAFLQGILGGLPKNF